jgi:protein-S-isoprenylcysteine O-methyltransferase Ste14
MRPVHRLADPAERPAGGGGDGVRETAGWRWGNVPLPEPHLVGLGAGILVHSITPWRPFRSAWVGKALGWPLIVAGLSLAAWAVRSAAAVRLEQPNQLVRSGPYGFSRNPMYVAWTLVYLGVALVVNTAWPLVPLPGVLVATHVVVAGEERVLEGRFDAAYRTYVTAVRRYL